MSSVIGTKS